MPPVAIPSTTRSSHRNHLAIFQVFWSRSTLPPQQDPSYFSLAIATVNTTEAKGNSRQSHGGHGATRDAFALLHACMHACMRFEFHSDRVRSKFAIAYLLYGELEVRRQEAGVRAGAQRRRPPLARSPRVSRRSSDVCTPYSGVHRFRLLLQFTVPVG